MATPASPFASPLTTSRAESGLPPTGVDFALSANDGRDQRLFKALIAAKIILLFILAWNSRFVMDEFAQLGFAKYFSDGMFDTVWPSKAAGYTAFAWVSHQIGGNAVSIVLSGRMMNALLACGTLAMIYGCARSLGQQRSGALLAVLVTLSFSNLMERIFRTNAEPLATFFAVAALLIVLRGGARHDQRRAGIIILAGVVSGLSFLATQKGVYFNLALGIALVGDAFLARHFSEGIRRGAWLVVGWLGAIAAYCLFFGGSDPLPVAANLVFGPAEVASRGGVEYGGLRGYVVQTLSRNVVLYALCFAGLLLSLRRIGTAGSTTRIAMIFSLIITLLVFAHDQPWPYVFVMVIPFLALWAPVPFTLLQRQFRRLTVIAVMTAIAISFVSNIAYLPVHNRDQLDLLARAEALVRPDQIYFDAIGMLPNRREPSQLWLDRHYVLKTLEEGTRSEAYQLLSHTPPDAILWSYRMDEVDRVISPLINASYVRVSPNIRLIGQRLESDRPQLFRVPRSGPFALYREDGAKLACRAEIDGRAIDGPTQLVAGPHTIRLGQCPAGTLILPQGEYAGLFRSGADDSELFTDVYR